MRVLLIFPPRTGPTYMPLGLACLAAVANVKNAELELFDANLELWNHLGDTSARVGVMRDFARGSLDLFLNSQVYAAKWSAMGDARREIDRLESEARLYLAGDGMETALRQLLERQAKKAEISNPQIVAFSVMYLDQLPFALALSKYLTRELHSGCRIVLGGASMSALSPVELLGAAPFVDAIMTGEGEIPFAELLAGASFSQISGCYHRDGDTVRFSGKTVVPENLGVLPNPDFSQLLTGNYFNPVPVMPIYGCRGCKWRRCRFCVHNNSFGRHRERPPMNMALEMLERRVQSDCRHFYVVDQYVDPVYLEKLSDAILALGLDCRFEVMARTIGEYTPALLAKAARAGCCWISWGMESGSQRLLNLMNKGTRPDVSLDVIKSAADVGISNLLMMIFGAPGSDRESLEETFTFLERAWGYIDGMTASAFVLFDQTAFSRDAAKYGLEILGKNPILDLEGKPLYDMKLRFRRFSENIRGESPLAQMEIEEWERRKAWLAPLPFHGKLCCEHYLLYADRQLSCTRPSTDLRSA